MTTPRPSAPREGVLDLDALERVAQAATSGPWLVRPMEFDDWGVIRGPKNYHVAKAFAGTVDYDENEHRRNKTDPFAANAAHIATFDPPTALAMIAQLRAMDSALRNVRMFAARNKHRNERIDADTILRFCAEGGVVSTILREQAGTAAPTETTP